MGTLAPQSPPPPTAASPQGLAAAPAIAAAALHDSRPLPASHIPAPTPHADGTSATSTKPEPPANLASISKSDSGAAPDLHRAPLSGSVTEPAPESGVQASQSSKQSSQQTAEPRGQKPAATQPAPNTAPSKKLATVADVAAKNVVSEATRLGVKPAEVAAAPVSEPESNWPSASAKSGAEVSSSGAQKRTEVQPSSVSMTPGISVNGGAPPTSQARVDSKPVKPVVSGETQVNPPAAPPKKVAPATDAKIAAPIAEPLSKSNTVSQPNGESNSDETLKDGDDLTLDASTVGVSITKNAALFVAPQTSPQNSAAAGTGNDAAAKEALSKSTHVEASVDHGRPEEKSANTPAGGSQEVAGAKPLVSGSSEPQTEAAEGDSPKTAGTAASTTDRPKATIVPPGSGPPASQVSGKTPPDTAKSVNPTSMHGRNSEPGESGSGASTSAVMQDGPKPQGERRAPAGGESTATERASVPESQSSSKSVTKPTEDGQNMAPPRILEAVPGVAHDEASRTGSDCLELVPSKPFANSLANGKSQSGESADARTSASSPPALTVEAKSEISNVTKPDLKSAGPSSPVVTKVTGGGESSASAKDVRGRLGGDQSTSKNAHNGVAVASAQRQSRGDSLVDFAESKETLTLAPASETVKSAPQASLLRKPLGRANNSSPAAETASTASQVSRSKPPPGAAAARVEAADTSVRERRRLSGDGKRESSLPSFGGAKTRSVRSSELGQSGLTRTRAAMQESIRNKSIPMENVSPAAAAAAAAATLAAAKTRVGDVTDGSPDGVLNGSASTESWTSAGGVETKSDPDMERLRAAHAARQSARRGPLRVPRGRVSASGGNTSPTPPSQPGTMEALKAEHDAAIAKLRVAHQVEIQSLHRNHIQNLKKVTAERDMFAAQLTKEQAKARSENGAVADTKRVQDLTMHLRASRIRTADLQAENARLLDEIKQLNFRLAAGRALDAESKTNEVLIGELVSVKLRCAQLEEEKEKYRQEARNATSSISMLKEANGDLEKSRAEWVLQCADLERQRAELLFDVGSPRKKSASSKTPPPSQAASFDSDQRGGGSTGADDGVGSLEGVPLN